MNCATTITIASSAFGGKREDDPCTGAPALYSASVDFHVEVYSEFCTSTFNLPCAGPSSSGYYCTSTHPLPTSLWLHPVTVADTAQVPSDRIGQARISRNRAQSDYNHPSTTRLTLAGLLAVGTSTPFVASPKTNSDNIHASAACNHVFVASQNIAIQQPTMHGCTPIGRLHLHPASGHQSCEGTCGQK